MYLYIYIYIYIYIYYKIDPYIIVKYNLTCIILCREVTPLQPWSHIDHSVQSDNRHKGNSCVLTSTSVLSPSDRP